MQFLIVSSGISFVSCTLVSIFVIDLKGSRLGVFFINGASKADTAVIRSNSMGFIIWTNRSIASCNVLPLQDNFKFHKSLPALSTLFAIPDVIIW